MDTAARIAGPAAVGTSVATVYTSPAPALTVTVLRLIHVSNPTGGAINFTLSIGADVSGTRFYDAFPIAAGSTLDWSGFVVLEASEIVQAKASAAGLVLTVSGVVVDDGVADNIAGPTGPAGRTVLNGTGAPGSGVGLDDDFYIDTDAVVIYGPKASGAWPGSGTSLVGAAGDGSGDMLRANNLSDLISASAARTNLGLGTAATQASGAFDAAGAATAAAAASQPLDSDLTAIAALSTTAYGRGLLALADDEAARTSLALGNSATRAVGTTAGTVAAGDDSRFGAGAASTALGLPYTVDPVLAGSGQNFGAAPRGHVARVHGSGTITKIGFQVTNSVGNLCVAVYSPSGTGRAAIPGVRKATSGSVACPANGYGEISLGGSVVVDEGDFFWVSSDDAATALICVGGVANLDIFQGVTGLRDGTFLAPNPGGAVAWSWFSKTFVLIGTP